MPKIGVTYSDIQRSANISYRCGTAKLVCPPSHVSLNDAFVSYLSRSDLLVLGA